jgi:exopolysaccharide biosynthesis polyprenyl glycosylphosphotransferase
MIAADAAAIVLAYILADILRCHLWQHAEWPEFIPGFGSSVRVHMKVLAFLPFAWPAILFWLGWYDPQWRSWTRDLRDALAGTAMAGMLMAALALLLERDVYPRAQVGFAAAVLIATTMLARGITGWVRQWYGSRRSRHVLIVGTSRDAVKLRRLLRSAALGRPVVVGHLRGPWETDAASIETGAIIGNIDQLGPILDDRVVDEVLFCTPIEHLAAVLPHVRLCEEVGVTAHVQAESMACHSIPEIVDFHGVPLLAYSPARHSPELLTIKRAIDVILAIIGIVLTAPIMLICAIVIKLTSPGPILFRQLRSGLNGRTFRMFKFRTMGPDAEARRHEVAHLDTTPGPTFKAPADPRVTAIGRVLRRWSLDELPQMFNVLKGDMAIVGPRPPIPAEVKQYDRWQRRRLSMRPGLTCLWQIKGRHRIGFQEWMQLDLFYIDHWSLRLDFLIVCKTVSIVLGGTGA